MHTEYMIKKKSSSKPIVDSLDKLAEKYKSKFFGGAPVAKDVETRAAPSKRWYE